MNPSNDRRGKQLSQNKDFTKSGTKNDDLDSRTKPFPKSRQLTTRRTKSDEADNKPNRGKNDNLDKKGEQVPEGQTQFDVLSKIIEQVLKEEDIKDNPAMKNIDIDKINKRPNTQLVRSGTREYDHRQKSKHRNKNIDVNKRKKQGFSRRDVVENPVQYLGWVLAVANGYIYIIIGIYMIIQGIVLSTSTIENNLYKTINKYTILMGVFCVFGGIIGRYGAVYKHENLIIAFVVFVFSTLAVVMFVLIKNNSNQKEVIHNIDQVLRSQLNLIRLKLAPAIKEHWLYGYMKDLDCCGVLGQFDVEKSVRHDLCCINTCIGSHLNDGCKIKIHVYYQDVITHIAVLFFSLGICAVIVAIYVICGIRNFKYEDEED